MLNIKRLNRLWLHPSFHAELTRITFFLLILALIQLLATFLPAWPNDKGINYYLPLHTFLETISIVISMMVFIVGWNTHGEKVSGNSVLLSCAFFNVGVLDFLHTISYVGMPDFISPNDAQKHLYYWLLSRLLAALVLLAVSLRDWKPLYLFLTRNLIFTSLTAGVVAFSWTVVAHQNWFPTTFIPGQGLTELKKNIEYVIIGINILTAAVLLAKMSKPQPFNIVLLFEAVCVMAMSEYFFTLYSTMKGSYNVLGHVYKVIAYFLIYRAIVVEIIEVPYRKLQQAEELLLRMNSELEERVDNRTKDLNDVNDTLNRANSELKRVQKELIQREKIAALGTLIAGVSHEMNTPLGNSLTIGSSLRDEAKTFKAEVENGKITKTRLNDFNQHLQSGFELLLKNLDRAIDQLKHFKQVSVDQASEQRRTFDLKSVIEDNVSILQPQFKHSRHQIVVAVSSDITMDSYPGALGQVITNLVLNALIHGFSADMNGVVSISARSVNTENIELVISDNGKGIPKKNLDHVFDPFFTTRMGQGGSGLGLSIVFNMVISTLNGYIEVDSEVGKHTTFTILIPVNVSEALPNAKDRLAMIQCQSTNDRV